MFEKLKRYLNNYSKEIDEQSQQGYDESLLDLWGKNAELAIKVCGLLNVRYLSLYRIEDIPEEHRESYKDRANCAFDAMELIVSYEHFRDDRPSDIVADRGYSLDALKSILSENYKPPKKIKDTLEHLLTLHFLYSHLMPTTPELSHAIPLRAGYALALLVSSALIKASVADGKGSVKDRTGNSTGTIRIRKDDMGVLVLAVSNDFKGKASISMVTNKINAAFEDLYDGKDLKSCPRYEGLIKNGYERLIKKLFNEWSGKNKETGIPQVSTDTVRRRLKANS